MALTTGLEIWFDMLAILLLPGVNCRNKCVLNRMDVLDMQLMVCVCQSSHILVARESPLPHLWLGRGPRNVPRPDSVVAGAALGPGGHSFGGYGTEI